MDYIVNRSILLQESCEDEAATLAEVRTQQQRVTVSSMIGVGEQSE